MATQEMSNLTVVILNHLSGRHAFLSRRTGFIVVVYGVTTASSGIGITVEVRT